MWKFQAVVLLLLVAPAVHADVGERPRWSLDLDWITDDYSGARGGEQTAMTQLGYRFSERVMTLRPPWKVAA